MIQASLADPLEAAKKRVNGWNRKYTHNKLFEKPNADSLLNFVVLPEHLAKAKKSKCNYPEFQYIIDENPYTNREGTIGLFLKLNYARYKAVTILNKNKSGQYSVATYKRVDNLLSLAKETRDDIALRNIRLCIFTAAKYAVFNIHPFDDLISRCLLDIFRVIDNFDVAKGILFSTYCINAMKQNLVRYCFRKPGHTAFNDRMHSTSEDGLTPDDKLSSVPEIADGRMKLEAVMDALRYIPGRERHVLMMRYGIGEYAGCGDLTLGQVGERFGVTKERIRQLETRAIEILQRHLR